MAFGYLNNSLILVPLIQASDFNEVINFYSKIPAFQYQNTKKKVI